LVFEDVFFTRFSQVDFALDTIHQPSNDPERRAFERVAVSVFGRCLLPNKLEIPCQAINMSPGDVHLVAAHLPKIKETVIVYLDHIGRLEGKVIRLYDSEFSMTIECTPRKREKLAASIEWLKAHTEFGGIENRRHERIEPENRNTEIKLEDGRSYPVEIIDISISGAALETDVKPALGSAVTFSGLKGKVVRHFSEGIAVEFDTLVEHGLIYGRFV
jgi:hypothetical protein